MKYTHILKHTLTQNAHASHLLSFLSLSLAFCMLVPKKEKRPFNFMPVEYEDDEDNKKYIVPYFFAPSSVNANKQPSASCS